MIFYWLCDLLNIIWQPGKYGFIVYLLKYIFSMCNIYIDGNGTTLSFVIHYSIGVIPESSFYLLLVRRRSLFFWRKDINCVSIIQIQFLKSKLKLWNISWHMYRYNLGWHVRTSANHMSEIYVEIPFFDLQLFSFYSCVYGIFVYSKTVKDKITFKVLKNYYANIFIRIKGFLVVI